MKVFKANYQYHRSKIECSSRRRSMGALPFRVKLNSEPPTTHPELAARVLLRLAALDLPAPAPALLASDSRSKMVVVRGRCATLRAVSGRLNGVGGRLRSPSGSPPPPPPPSI